MAHRYWGVNLGQTKTDVVEGASTNSTDVEVNLDLSKNLSREDLLLALEYIQMAVLEDNWPPA